MATRPKLSVIIPLRQTKAQHRDVKRLENCLASLAAQTAAGQFEVIVSDTDSTPAFHKAHEATCKAAKVKYVYTKTGKPWNISRARNIGIRAARGEYVMVTDMDCLFRPDFMATVLKHAADDAIVHCRICDLPPEHNAALDDWATLDKISIMRPAWCFGGCQAVSRKWAESVHGYDERFELWGAEDTDLMERATAAGKRNVWIESETAYYHQYHPKDNRTENPEQLARNRARLKLTEAKQLPLVRNPHEWGGKPEPGEWDDTAVIITTFMRDPALELAVKSIRKYYPTIDIVIADNGQPSAEREAFAATYDCQYEAVPFDSGVTVARNAGVRSLDPRYKYVVIIEDDICFTGETDLEKWRRLLDKEPSAGVAGCLLHIVTDIAGGSDQHYEATIELRAEDRTAYLREIADPEWKEHKGTRYHFADIVLNVFMARREVLDALLWDENIKSAPEHCDWFIGLKYKTPWKVIYTPDVSMAHYKSIANTTDENYLAYRKRPGAFQYFASKWGIDKYWNSFNPQWGIANPQSLGTYAEVSLQARRAVLAMATKALNATGVKWWLEAGTCLGAIREKNFIGHDPDIDIGVWTENPEAMASTIEAGMHGAGFETYRRWEWNGKLLEISFTKSEYKLDVFFFRERGGFAWHGAFGPQNDNGLGEFTVFLPHVFSLGLFKDLREIEFVGMRAYVPNPPEQYLTERYGPDWKTPNRGYRYWTDCRAVARKFFEPEKATAYIGGVWDVFHHGHLNILERCKRLAGRLVVGVLTDKAASAYKPRPLIPENERLRIIRSLRMVDEAVFQHSQDPTEDLQRANFRPDYLVHGDDWDFVPGADYVRANGGMALTLPYTRDISSTLIKLMGGGDGRVRVKRVPPPGGIEYAVGIKTFMRERTLARTVAAFEKNLTVPFRFYIADDSGNMSDRKRAMYQDLQKRGAVVIERPFDTGLSAGRNAITKATSEPYVLITDDDIALDGQDSLDRMRAVLDARPDIGLVAAIVNLEQGGPFASPAYVRGLRLERVGRLLKRVPIPGRLEKAPLNGGGEDTLFTIADQVPNCFLARRELFEDARWDERIKIEFEHMDFFLALMQGGKWKSAVAVEATATHFKSEPDMDYERHRRAHSSAYLKGKWGIDNIINQF